MSIKKQFYILSVLIILIPLTALLFVEFHRYFTASERLLLHGYKEIRKANSSSLSDSSWDAIYQSLKMLPPDVEALWVKKTRSSDDYTIVYSTLPDIPANSVIKENILWNTIKAGSAEFFFQLTTFRAQDNERLIMITRIPRVKKNDPQHNNRVIRYLIILIFVFVLFLVFYIIQISKRIFDSITLIEEKTQQMADGELSVEIDVNPRKKANEITSIANSLEKMRRALVEAQNRKNKFIMGISHDLRTPVAVIKGYTEALSDGVITSHDEQQQALSLIATKTSQLEDMIDTLINYTRLESGQLREQLVPGSITELITEFARNAEVTGNVFSRRIITEIGLDEDIEIPLNKQLVMRAFENIFSNALRYTKDDDEIRICARSDAQNITLAISDTGCGISKEDLPLVFDLFYRGTNSRREEGMGIGLSVVKNIIDTHGWQISVTSEKGKGTCFTITIPR